MTEPILEDVCQQPRLIATTEKYAQLVYDSTTELHQPVQSILSALDRRAIGLTKCLNFESALRDAKLMQQLSPSSALGYLRAAEVYSQQGKQRQALDICNDGINKVDSKDTHYASLVQLKMDATQRGNTRMDFVSQLPIDIVITTLIPMIMEDNLVKTSKPCAYLQVSNVWSDRIIQCFNGLRFEVDELDDMSQAIQFSQHTKSLHIQQGSEGNWHCDLIRDNSFSSLEELRIYCFAIYDIGNLVSALKSVSSTLTHLEVDTSCAPGCSTDELVLACPNLVSFRIHEAPDVDFGDPATTTAWPNLTTLCIFGAHEEITCQEIITMWERFPSLKELSLYPCQDFSSAFIVSRFLPRMKWLDIETLGEFIRLTFSDEGPQNEELGITRITVGSLDEELEDGAFRDICSIITHHHKTLEQIQWTLRTDHDSDILGGVQYPRLKKLYICCTGWQIPRNAPMLEEFVLNSTIINQHPEVLDTIPPHLKKLELRLFSLLRPADKSSILRYLHRISQGLRLEELAIIFNSLDTIDNMLDAVYLHHHLECLKIRFTKEWDSNRMNTFLHDLVEACPRLVSLELIATMAPTPSSVDTLKRLKHLKEFAFSARNIQDEDCFWHAIRTFDQLKCITLHPTDLNNNAHILRLRHQRPDIKIISDMYLIPVR
ncbi:predicted protein [Lichtheimia corymbifera JMRC:FSU:9682]|uniref:F-box domain-containing protein n=1 Tax=Lichtheimia corymbifera JMRC:FSU:9682 TaxID=1263082 RepID=A0A068S6T9_9FUNG|nr:predicted protein [Lichtheimia corymbifera JMRC:FSU:9682]